MAADYCCSSRWLERRESVSALKSVLLILAEVLEERARVELAGSVRE